MYLSTLNPHPLMPPTNRRRKSQNKREKGPEPELRVRKGQDLHYQQVTIAILPDDVLLEIFYFALENVLHLRLRLWQRLVHVCRRWRQVVLASPLRLNLQLRCTEFTPARKMLGVWPALPIVIEVEALYRSRRNLGVGSLDNIIAALEQNDRICRVDLRGFRSLLIQEFAAIMQGPFPALTYLDLAPQLDEELAQVLPDSFLGGYGPHLQELSLPDIPIAVFQKLPVSSPNLTDLRLWKISYISPETMTNCLSPLSRLKSLILDFHSRLHPSLTDRTSRRPSPLTRAVLPSLTSLQFKGISEYLEELVSRVDIPLLEDFSVTFFNQVMFDISQLPQFISRTEKFKALNRAGVAFYDRSVKVRLAEKRGTTNRGTLDLEILCATPDWQLSSVAQLCNSFLHQLSTLDDLGIHRDCVDQLRRWPDDMEGTQWLELLSPLTTVKHLYVSKELSPHVTLALEDLPGERVTDVVPALEHLSIADFCPRTKACIKENVKQFIAARQLFGRPVTVHHWNGRFDEG